MRTTRLRATSNLVSRAVSVTGEVLRETRALRRGAKRMPKPVPWDWAAPRILPILSGPSLDQPGESLIRARSKVGPMVQFGVDLGAAFMYVDVAVAQRWECSSDQLMDQALRNLSTRAGRIQGMQVVSGVMSGRPIRLLRDRPRWASSLILAPHELFRLFGDHDQILGTPSESCLVSLPMDTPSYVVADILVDFERRTPRPLWLDPFIVANGQISWSDDGADGDDDERW
jgi:hypothetical protein